MKTPRLPKGCPSLTRLWLKAIGFDHMKRWDCIADHVVPAVEKLHGSVILSISLRCLHFILATSFLHNNLFLKGFPAWQGAS
jgi:hypothetical protein